MTEEIDPSL